MIYVIEGRGARVNEKGVEQPFKMICGVPKEFE